LLIIAFRGESKAIEKLPEQREDNILNYFFTRGIVLAPPNFKK
jgi:hypothetical protein